MDVLLLIWMHYLADFLCQPRYLAETKSTNTKSLILHCVMYSVPFFWFGWQYAVLNGVLHFIVDWPSSRIIRYYWYKDKKYVAFSLIGLDQALHLTCLYVTLIKEVV